MAMTSTNSAAILRPEVVSDLVVKPLIARAVATTAATPVRTNSPEFRVPVVETDATSAWLNESEEFTPSDVETAPVVVTPTKVGALVRVPNELMADSDPSAMAVVGDSVVRSLRRSVDQAFTGNLADPAPKGLASLTGVIEVAAGAAFSVDSLYEGMYAAAAVDSQITAWIMSAEDMAAFAVAEKESLAASAHDGVEFRVAGAPIIVTPDTAPGVIWGVPRATSFAVIREDVTLAVSTDRFFTSDETAIRAVARVAFAWAHPEGIVKITTTP